MFCMIVIVIMFHIIQSIPIKLDKPRTCKILFLLPLSQNRVVAITDDNYLLCYSLTNKKIIHEITLTNRPRKVAVLSNDNIILLLPQTRTLVELNLHVTKKLPYSEVIHLFEKTSHYLLPPNPIRQKEYYSTMKMQSFLFDLNCYVIQQNSQSRKQTLKLFQKVDNKWTMKIKQLGPVKGKITKINEKNQLAIIKQDGVSQGMLRFHMFTIQNTVQEQIVLQSQSFTQFSTIIAIKESKGMLFVQINKKNPELVCFANYFQRQSSKVSTNIVWVVNLKDFIFQLGFSLKKPQLSVLQIRRESEHMDEVQSRFQNIQICKSGLVLQYERQRTPGQIITLNTHRPISKSGLYISMMKRAFSRESSIGNFLNEVISLLEG